MSTSATTENFSWTVKRLWKGTFEMPRQATRVETWKTNIASASFPAGTFSFVRMYQMPMVSRSRRSSAAPPRWTVWQMLNIRFGSPPGLPSSMFMKRCVVTASAPVITETRATVLPTAL